NIKSLEQRRQRLLEETGHYESLQGSQGKLTGPQGASVLDLASQQKALAEETLQLGQKLPSPVFQLSLDKSASEMHTAAGLLAQSDLGGKVERAQKSALARLQQLLAALKPDSKPKENKPK